MEYTHKGLEDLEKQLAEYRDIFEKGIKTATEHVKAIHLSTLLNVPDDLEQRLWDASDRGDLIIRKDGAVSFVSAPKVKTKNKK